MSNDIHELAETYRADPVKYYEPTKMFHPFKLWSPGFHILGFVTTGYRKDENGEYGVGLTYITFDRFPHCIAGDDYSRAQRAKHLMNQTDAGRGIMSFCWRRI